MKNDLDGKIEMAKIICNFMNREKDDHLHADLYKLTNRTLGKLVRVLEANQIQRLERV